MKPALELSPAAKGSIVFGSKWPEAVWQAPSWARFRLDALARPSRGYAFAARDLRGAGRRRGVRRAGEGE